MYISGFTEDKSFLEDFSLVKGAGRHASLSFKLLLPRERVQELMGKVGEKITAKLTEKQKEPVFKGIVTQAITTSGFAGEELELVCASESIELDEEGKRRLFQNPEKKLGEILSALDMGPCSLQLADKYKDAAYAPVVCQNMDTDFHFLKRMAALAGFPLWLDDMNIKPTLVVAGCVSEKKHEFHAEGIFAISRIKSRKEAERLRLISEEFVNPGFLATLPQDSATWLILSVNGRLEHGTDLFEYELCQYEEPEIKIAEHCSLPPLKLAGKVVSAEDPDNLGRVRIKFTEIEDETPDDKKLWIPYCPAWAGKNSGIVFIPDRDDQVEAFFLNGEIYCSSAIRENPLAEECRKVKDKAICNNSGQRIFWKEESLELLSAENRLYMDKEKIELTVGENMFRLEKDKVLLQTPKSQISMEDNLLRLQTNGKLEHVSKDSCVIQTSSDGTFKSSGKLALSASGKMEIKGSSVDVDGSGSVNISGSRINLS